MTLDSRRGPTTALALLAALGVLYRLLRDPDLGCDKRRSGRAPVWG